MEKSDRRDHLDRLMRFDLPEEMRESLGFNDPHNKAIADALRGVEFVVYDDESWHTFDENGRPCQFFKDGTRRYS